MPRLEVVIPGDEREGGGRLQKEIGNVRLAFAIETNIEQHSIEVVLGELSHGRGAGAGGGRHHAAKVLNQVLDKSRNHPLILDDENARPDAPDFIRLIVCHRVTQTNDRVMQTNDGKASFNGYIGRRAVNQLYERTGQLSEGEGKPIRRFHMKCPQPGRRRRGSISLLHGGRRLLLSRQIALHVAKTSTIASWGFCICE